MSGETDDTTADHGARIERVAWLVSFVVPMVVLLLILLLAAKPSGAVTVTEPPPSTPPPTTPPPEPEDEPVGEEEGEEAVVEEELETGPYPPDECLLRTARARVFAYTSRDKVRLVIRYTSLAPAEVTVDYWMKGKKGPLALGKARKRFAKKGLFRLTENLSKTEMEKIRAAKDFTVTMTIPAAPTYCNQYYSRHLTIKRTVKNQILWFQSDSIFGTAQ